MAVRDSGPGFDPRDAERIFDAFFTTKAEGLGLGLAISQLYIVAGPQGIRGEGRNSLKNKIADGQVTVPNKVWKVILVLEDSNNDRDIERVTADTRLIAVIMPNDPSVPQDNWWQYRVSVKDVEETTGFTFFDKIPANIINPLEDEVDTEFIPVLPREH